MRLSSDKNLRTVLGCWLPSLVSPHQQPRLGLCWHTPNVWVFITPGVRLTLKILCASEKCRQTLCRGSCLRHAALLAVKEKISLLNRPNSRKLSWLIGIVFLVSSSCIYLKFLSCYSSRS